MHRLALRRFTLRPLALLLVCLATPALAQAHPTLRASITVSSDLVRLGDMVGGLASGADEPVFRAPELGTTGTVQAARVADAARQHGVEDLDTAGLREVSVTRASRTVTLDEIRRAVAQAIARQNGLDAADDLQLSLDPAVRPLHVEPGLTAPLSIAELTWNPASGRFDAALGIEGSALLDRSPLRLNGVAQETALVPVFMTALGRGDVVRASDVALQRLPRGQATAGAVEAIEAALGQAVRRSTRPGQPVLTSDLTKPEVVGRNDDVLITYEVPGLVLTVRGKALQAGAQGDMVPVLNAQSKRVVQAAVIAPGRVSVATPASVASLD